MRNLLSPPNHYPPPPSRALRGSGKGAASHVTGSLKGVKDRDYPSKPYLLGYQISWKQSDRTQIHLNLNWLSLNLYMCLVSQ